MTADEARARLLALGLDADAAEVLFDHFADSERRGKLGHGFSRIPWLETQGFDLDARPVKGPRSDGIDRWDANGAARLPDARGDLRRRDPRRNRRARGSSSPRLLPDRRPGYWARRVAAAGYVVVLTATSPDASRLPPAGHR